MNENIYTNGLNYEKVLPEKEDIIEKKPTIIEETTPIVKSALAHYSHFRLQSKIIIPAVIEFLTNLLLHFVEILNQNLILGGWMFDIVSYDSN